MNLRRLLRHLLTPQWWVLRAFNRETLDAVEHAVSRAEQGHRGELRFVVEGLLPLGDLLRDVTARQRAVQLFSDLRVWDTEQNSGILIYVQMADRRVEVLADRGIAKQVQQSAWDEICRTLEHAFAAGHYRQGAVAAVEQAGALLSGHSGPFAENPDEISDRPLVV